MVGEVWEKTNCLSRHWQLFRAVFSVDKSNMAHSVAPGQALGGFLQMTH